MNVRIAGATLIKNEAIWRWKAGPMAFALNMLKGDEFFYDEETKKMVRDNYLEAMAMCEDPKILKLLGHGAAQILMRDADTLWSNYDDLVLNGLKNAKDKKTMFSMIVAFNATCKAKQCRVSEDREGFNDSAVKVMPFLKNVLVDILKSGNQDEAIFIQWISKIFFRMVRTDLLEYFREAESNKDWMDIMTQSLKYAIQGLTAKVGEDTLAEDVEDFHQCKILKFVLKAIRRYIFKYANASYEDDSLGPWCENWESTYALPFFDLFLEILKHRKQLKLPKNIIIILIRNIQYFAAFKIIRAERKQQYFDLLANDGFEIMKFTPEDQEKLEFEPIEYLREHEAETYSFNVRHEIINMVSFCMRHFEDSEIHKLMMELIAKKITDDSDIIAFEAALHLGEKIHDHILARVDEQVIYSAGLLLSAIKMFKTEHKFAKFRACKVIDKVLFPGFDEDNMLNEMSKSVVELMSDENLAMRAVASQTLTKLLAVPKLKDHFTPHLKDILLQFLKLVNEIESDTLMNSFQDMFDIYSDQIAPFAIDLIKTLTEIFEKMIAKEAKLSLLDEEDDDMNCMQVGAACIACINAIREILKAPIGIDVVRDMYPFIERICLLSFNQDQYDYYDDAISMLSMFVMKFKDVGFPDPLWGYLTVSCYYLTGIQNKRTDLIPEGTPDALIQLFNGIDEQEVSLIHF